MTDAPTLYDEDFVAWTEQQAEALRAAASGGVNQPLDWENLAEEIESLGRSDRRELHSQIYRIIRHLTKLEYSAALDPCRGWRESIVDGRMQVELVLADSPSLQRELEQVVLRQGTQSDRARRLRPRRARRNRPGDTAGNAAHAVHGGPGARRLAPCGTGRIGKSREAIIV